MSCRQIDVIAIFPIYNQFGVIDGELGIPSLARMSLMKRY